MLIPGVQHVCGCVQFGEPAPSQSGVPDTSVQEQAVTGVERECVCAPTSRYGIKINDALFTYGIEEVAYRFIYKSQNVIMFSLV